MAKLPRPEVTWPKGEICQSFGGTWPTENPFLFFRKFCRVVRNGFSLVNVKLSQGNLTEGKHCHKIKIKLIKIMFQIK